MATYEALVGSSASAVWVAPLVLCGAGHLAHGDALAHAASRRAAVSQGHLAGRGVAMPATSTQAQSIMDAERRCRDDFSWACANVLYIRPKEQPLLRLALNWRKQYVYEHSLWPAWRQREPLALTVLKTRRVGMTTLFMAWLYHKIRWYRGQNCYVVANDDPTLADIFMMAT